MNMQGVRVLVTGGAGFIGSHLVDSLVRQGAKVRILDNFSSGLRENLAGVLKDVEIVEGDVRDRGTVVSAMAGCRVVSHQAAQLEITKCLEDPIDDLIANTHATINVFEAAAKSGVERVIYASSACVYGQPEYIPSDEAKHPTNPNWPYGVSKLACEKYAATYHERTGIPMTGLRYAIIYGPREWYGRVLTIFLKRLAAQKSPVVFGDGSQQRDFTYVGDVVALNDAVLAKDLPGHEVLNVSTGIATTVAELARLSVDVTGVAMNVVHEDVQPGQRSAVVEEQRMRLPSELSALVLDPRKAERLLGWKAAVDLPTGLLREYRWLLENPERWRKMSY
jgi:UDP-glucose 4-epimerase